MPVVPGISRILSYSPKLGGWGLKILPEVWGVPKLSPIHLDGYRGVKIPPEAGGCGGVPRILSLSPKIGGKGVEKMKGEHHGFNFSRSGQAF